MTPPFSSYWIVDFVYSSLLIIFSSLCIVLARRLAGKEPQDIAWTYLEWLSYGLAVVAVSRTLGRMAACMPIDPQAAGTIRDYSDAATSMMLVVLGSVTVFFDRSRRIHQQLFTEKRDLVETSDRLLTTNRRLEELVAERSERLASTERKYRSFFESSQDMIVVASEDGTVIEVNPEAARMFGVSRCREAGSGCSFKDFFIFEQDWSSVAAAMQADGRIPETEFRLRGTGGVQFSGLLSGTAEKSSACGSVTMHFLVKDISRRKNMEQQLLQADKLASIGQLAAGIAHEINNPLSIILGYTQLLLRGEPQGTQHYQDYKIMEKHARTCKTIVGDLLSFSRSTRTRKDVGHLHTAINEILGVLRNHFELDQVKLEKELDPAMPEMVMDEPKIKQVLMNLLMNAKQAIGKKGTIYLLTRYEAPRGQAVVRVADTGTGISPEHLSRIFDPFFTTKGTGEGTGLGLSVSYGIVKDHGGEILVESRPGKGSVFTVILPVNTEKGDHDQRNPADC
ncbi:MAG: PAS domain S-box protein [Syntrophobacteraceae bacterium]|nr:PAS domain S-box protein [Syntrophobacteraceae bacterium]